MILGVLSDTHGQVERAGVAVRLLRRVGAEALVHCGDIGSPEVIEQLAGWPAWAVWGNTDPRDERLAQYAESLGVTMGREVPLRICLGERNIAVFHGDERPLARLEMYAERRDPRLLTDWLRDCDYVLRGHSHTPCDVNIGRVRLVNPGALQRASVYTVATIDLARDVVRFWQVTDNDGEPVEHFLDSPVL